MLGARVARGLCLAGLLVLSACGKPPLAQPGSRLPAEDALSESPKSWLMFGHDLAHSGNSPVKFSSRSLELAWKFPLGEHRYRYQRGMSVWSSPVIAGPEGRPSVFLGAYDRCLYALDAATGKKRWRRAVGNAIFAAPAYALIDGVPMIFFGATDRTVYAFRAADGEKVWSLECQEWSDTITPSVMSPAAVARVQGKPVLFLGVWTNDRQARRAMQRGEVVAIDAAKGAFLWRRAISTSPVNAPVIAQVEGRPFVFVTCLDGQVFALDASTGERRWKMLAHERVHSSPMFAQRAGRGYLYFGTRFHSLYCVTAGRGREVFRRRANNWVESTPAATIVDGVLTAFYGSYDRNVYAIRADDGRIRWTFTTRNDVCSAPVCVEVEGKPAIFVHSLDNHLYGLGAATGEKFWQYDTGACVFPYYERGASVWASPGVAEVKGQAILVFPSYDGNVYAFRSVAGKAVGETR